MNLSSAHTDTSLPLAGSHHLCPRRTSSLRNHSPRVGQAQLQEESRRFSVLRHRMESPRPRNSPAGFVDQTLARSSDCSIPRTLPCSGSYRRLPLDNSATTNACLLNIRPVPSCWHRPPVRLDRYSATTVCAPLFRYRFSLGRRSVGCELRERRSERIDIGTTGNAAAFAAAGTN